MRTIDNHNAIQTYEEYAKPSPKKVADKLARLSMVEPVLGDQLEDENDVYQIPASKEVQDYDKQQQIENADLGDNLDDERDDDLDGGEEDKNPGFSIRDYTDDEPEADEVVDELPEDAEVVEPDDEEVVDEEVEDKE